MEYKIFSYLDAIEDAYREPVELVDGLYFDHKNTLRTIEFYSNNQYLSGNKDAMGREKPFYNVCNFRVTTAKTATDLDVKDIRFEPDSLKFSVQAMLFNAELYNYLKETNFSQTLNEMGQTRPKYGGLLVKKVKKGEKLDIQVVDWKNVDVDPCDILGGAIIENHWLFPSELASKRDLWYDVDEVLEEHSKLNKNKPAKIHVKEITGEFEAKYDPEDEDEESDEFRRLCVYIAEIGEKKFYLYREEIKDIRDKYRYLAWDAVPGRGLGRGVVEDGFEAQVWTNDAVQAQKNAMELAGKVILGTDSQKISGNAITGVQSGHIFQMEQGRTLTSLNLSASSMPEFERMIEQWNNQYDRVSSTYDANTGEAPTAGTPYSQTALLNQIANSPFEYQREVWGIFLNELLNDWILPHLKRRIMKPHALTAQYDAEDLDVIDESIVNFESNKIVKERALNRDMPSPQEVQQMKGEIQQRLGKSGAKREVQVPEKYLDVAGKLTANITGELKNKGAMLQSLDSLLKTVVMSFDPNTGQYGVLQDPTLNKLFSQIIEMAGIPLSSAQLRPQGGSVPSGDISAVQPVTPQQA